MVRFSTLRKRGSRGRCPIRPDLIDAFIGALGDGVGARRADDVDIVAGPAGERVGAASAVQHVVAGAAGQGVVAIAAGECVVARAAIEEVVADPAVQRVVAETAIDHVVAVATKNLIVPAFAAQIAHALVAEDEIVAGVAETVQGAGADQQQVLDVGESLAGKVDIDPGDHGVEPLPGCFRYLIGDAVHAVHIVAGAAGHHVAADPAEQGVASAATQQRVAAIATVQPVVAVLAIEDVVEGVTGDFVADGVADAGRGAAAASTTRFSMFAPSV